MPVHIEIVSAAENVLAEKTLRVGVGNRLLHDLEQIAILAANVDVARVRAHRDSRDYHAFDHGVRIMLEDQSVFASPRLAFIAVAQDVFRLRRSLGNERPFQARVESRAAAPTQSRILDFVDNRVRLHAQRLAHRLVPVELDVAVDIRRALSKALRNYAYLIGM